MYALLLLRSTKRLNRHRSHEWSREIHGMTFAQLVRMISSAETIFRDIFQFVEQVSAGNTATRTFAVQGPSGWGKSSLVIKLVDLVGKGRLITNCSLTAVDSRSATSAAFVSGAL